MPASKGRKKKKNKQKAKSEKVFRKPGMEFVRKGKHIFLKNTMNSEEHAAYIEQLRENRPQFYEEIRTLLQETVDSINSYDKIQVMGAVASFFYYRMLTDEMDDGLSEVLMEYCQSIAAASVDDNKGKEPPVKILKQICDSLETLRSHFSAYFAIEHVEGRYSETESRIRHDMISDSLFIRGEGYYVHIRELFLELFSPHNSFLEQHYNFIAEDILHTFDKLELGYACRVLMPNGDTHPISKVVFRQWMTKNKSRFKEKDIQSGAYLNEYVKDHPEVIVERNGMIVYPLNATNLSEQLYRIRLFDDRQKKVVEALSMKFGENNVFAKPEKFKYEILNKSNIYSYPIIRDGDQYYLFSMNLAARNFFRIGQNLIENADKDYYQRSFLGNRVQIAKDEFFERKVLSLFEKMLPETFFYKGVYYQHDNPGLRLKCANAEDGRYELDILGISDQATYLIEVKAGLMSEESKRGALSSIKKDLSGIIGDAICQSYRAYQYMHEVADAFFQKSNGEIIHPINRTVVLRISISFSYMGSIIASLSRLRDFGVIDKESSFAWTVNIFDFIPFTELMENEAMFIDYLQKRLPMYDDPRLSHVDEMNMLGLYFENDIKIDKQFENVSSVHLHAYKNEIDEYFDRGGKKPVKKKSKQKKDR